jgi:hypothetical protein
LENSPTSVYYPFTIKLHGASSSCSYFTFLEDHDHSARYNFGEVSSFSSGTITVSHIPPTLPDGWTGALVFDSYDCDEDIRTAITVANPFEENGLWVYRHGDSDVLTFLWRIGALDGLSAEAPGDSVVLTVQRQSDHTVLAKAIGENVGILEGINFTGLPELSELEFVIAPAYCFKLSTLCNAVYSAVIQNVSLFPALDPTTEPAAEFPLMWALIIGGLVLVAIGLFVAIIVLLVKRRRLRCKKKKQAKKTKSLSSSGFLSAGLVEIRD